MSGFDRKQVVDRRGELKTFLDFAQVPGGRLLRVVTPPKTGKSTLLALFQYEATVRKIAALRLRVVEPSDFTKDMTELSHQMRRRRIQRPAFDALFAPAPTSAPELHFHAHLEQSGGVESRGSSGDTHGHQAEMHVHYSADRDGRRGEKVGDALAADLHQASRSQPVVLLLDQWEKATSDHITWLTQLVQTVFEDAGDGTTSNLAIVVAASEKLEIIADHEIDALALQAPNLDARRNQEISRISAYEPDDVRDLCRLLGADLSPDDLLVLQQYLKRSNCPAGRVEEVIIRWLNQWEDTA